MLIVQSKSTDVYRNLAVEEWLLDHAPRLPVLFLCVNDPCVVIGKNQNPWRECRLSLMDKEGVPLARRVSGGGAVYHDPGNLNVSVIVPRTEYVEQKQYDLIFQAIALRHKLSILGKNSLGVDGLKFSGQAFCHRRDRSLHHGTILVNADLDRLGRYLGPEFDGIETKAIASVPSRVANLSQVAPELTVTKLSAALTETFIEVYGSDGVTEWWSDADVQNCAGTQFLPIIGKISSNDWKLGHTPRFTFRGLQVEGGRVVNMEKTPLFNDFLKKRELLVETIKAMMTRRSIRAFKETPLTEEQIKTLLEAAMNAPSAGDGRPWHFVVTTRRAQLDALADAVDEGNEMFKQAQAAILICLDRSLEGFQGFGEQDCSCAAQNLQLAAHDLGLGTVWIAIINVPPRTAGCRTVLGVPEEMVPFALFPLGVPDEELEAEYRYDETRIHREQWQSE